MTSDADELAALGRSLGPRARHDHPLGALTTYRVGGTAALFVEPEDEDQLVEVARALRGLSVPVLVLGRGSNLLVADRGFAGLVVSLGPGFESLSIDGEQVRAGAALSLPVLARRTAAAGLHGLEWAVGVPGSVGGAIRMNAGGHGSDTAATLVAYRWVDLATGTVAEAPAGRLGFSYRHSTVAPTDVVVAGVHQLEPRPTPRRARRPSTRSSAGGGPTSPGAATPGRSSPIRPGTRPAGSSRPAASRASGWDRPSLDQARQLHPGRPGRVGRRRLPAHRPRAVGGGRGHRRGPAHRGAPGRVRR